MSTRNLMKFNVNQLNYRLKNCDRFKKVTGTRPSLSTTRKDGSIIELSTIDHDQRTTWLSVRHPDGTGKSDIVYILDLQYWNGEFTLFTVSRSYPDGKILVVKL